MADALQLDPHAKRLARLCSPLGIAGALAGLAGAILVPDAALSPASAPERSAPLALAVVIATVFVMFGFRGVAALLTVKREKPLAELATFAATAGAVVAIAAVSIGAPPERSGLGALWSLLLLGLAPALAGLAFVSERRSFLLGAAGIVSGLFVCIAAAMSLLAGNEVAQALLQIAVAGGLLWHLAANAVALRLALAPIALEASASAASPARPSRAGWADDAVRLSLLVLVGLSGWVFGSFYPLPHPTLDRIDRAEIETRVRAYADRAVNAAVQSGQLIRVERVAPGESMEGPDPDVNGAAPAIAAPAAAGLANFETSLSKCPGMTVSNAPPAGADRRLVSYAPIVNVNGVALGVNPTRGACLSSAFGARGSRQHNGLDYHSRVGGPILAAGDGVILEMKYRDDFGNMLVIDHGNGVYTRYAHLSSFRAGLSEGARVRAGEQVGLMGNTAARPLPIHLHYEVLLGDYANPRGSFGLEARDPFGFPAAGAAASPAP